MLCCLQRHDHRKYDVFRPYIPSFNVNSRPNTRAKASASHLFLLPESVNRCIFQKFLSSFLVLTRILHKASISVVVCSFPLSPFWYFHSGNAFAYKGEWLTNIQSSFRGTPDGVPYERLLARVHDTSVSYRGVWRLCFNSWEFNNQNRRMKSLYNLFAMEAQSRHNSEFVIETNLLNLISNRVI